MKVKEMKKTIKKAAKATQIANTRITKPKKVAKNSDTKTSKTKKSASVEIAAKTKKIAQKPVITKPAENKKALAAKSKAEVEAKAKPKAKVTKVSAVKPKPKLKAEKKTPKKKVVTVKAEVEAKAKPKAKVTKVSAVKPKPKLKAEKKAVAAKREQAFPVIPSLKSVATAKKYETREEPKPKAERYPIISSKARLKIFLPEQNLTKSEAEEIFTGGLPEEYGENSVIALVVDPNTVFVDWEVIPKDISDMEGDLNLRFYDITGIEFNDWNAHAILDIPINKRVGSDFFDIRMPGRDVVVAVGILSAVNGFMPIIRSDMISFPELLTFDELGIVQKLFESGIAVGY